MRGLSSSFVDTTSSPSTLPFPLIRFSGRQNLQTGVLHKFWKLCDSTREFTHSGFSDIVYFQQIQKLVAPPISDDAARRSRRRNRTAEHRRHGRTVNHDCCDSCKEGGDLLCCDRCPAAFHLLCQWVVAKRITISLLVKFGMLTRGTCAESELQSVADL